MSGTACECANAYSGDTGGLILAVKADGHDLLSIAVGQEVADKSGSILRCVDVTWLVEATGFLYHFQTYNIDSFSWYCHRITLLLN